jgi:glycosyl transferase family 87
VLAWRALHEPALAGLPAALPWLLPRPPAVLDRDPLALLLAFAAVALALAYAAMALAGGSRAARGRLIALAGAFLVMVPTAGLMAMGALTHRPYGQDGGVVQLPLAMDKILAGQSPYGADYSDSILGKEARASGFWEGYGPNPILHHHAYLPGTHVLMLPFHLLGRLTGLGFDPRVLTLLAWMAAAVVGWRLLPADDRGLAALALVVVNPLVYWPQVFGANDMLQVALVLLATLFAVRDRPVLAGAVMGLCCATKQLAWPYAPFLFACLSGAGTLRELVSPPARRRLVLPLLAAAAVFVAVVAPIALLDPRAFWADIVGYNVGQPGTDNYPLGGTPGFGLANLWLVFGAVGSLRDYVSFAPFYLLLVPAGLWLLRYALRARGPGSVLVAGSAALLLSVYLSRVAHPNYLIPVAVLLPIGALLSPGLVADVVAVPLALLALAVEIVGAPVLQAAWGRASRAPGTGTLLTSDPAGLLVSALLAGLAVVYLLVGLAVRRVLPRAVLIAAAFVVSVVVPTAVLMGLFRTPREPRAQDAWVAQMAAAGGPGRAPGVPVREAWSQSFRRDPPAELPADGPGPPATRTLAGLPGPPGGDPRPLTLVAAVIFALLVVRLVPLEHRPLAAAAVLLSPAAAMAIVCGSPIALALAGIAAVVCLARAERWTAAGLVLGAVTAAVPHPIALVVAGWPRDRPARRPFVTGLALGFAALVAPAAILEWRTAWAALGPGALGAGVGLWNVSLYAGRVPSWIPVLGWAAAPLLVIVASRWLGLRDTFARAAVLSLVALLLAAGASPHELALPMVAAVVAALPHVGSEPLSGSPRPS